MPRSLHTPAAQSGRQSRSAAEILGNKKPRVARGLVFFGATEVLPQPPVAKPNTPHYEVLSHEFCQSE